MQRGYTLIELICTLVIVGVLASSAVPRFQDLSDSAHYAVVEHTAAALDTGVRLANIGCLVESHAGLDNLPGFGANNVDFNANCFPSSTNGNNNLNVNAARCMQVWNGLLAGAPTISTPAIDATAYRAQGSGTTCTYTYRKDTDDLRRFTYNASSGAVTVTANP